MRCNTIEGSAVRIYPHSTSSSLFRKQLLGTADYIAVTSRSCYIELGSIVPVYLEGEIQVGFVIEQIEKFINPIEQQETLSRSPRYIIEFIDEEGNLRHLSRCMVDTVDPRSKVTPIRIEGVADSLHNLVISK